MTQQSLDSVCSKLIRKVPVERVVALEILSVSKSFCFKGL